MNNASLGIASAIVGIILLVAGLALLVYNLYSIDPHWLWALFGCFGWRAGAKLIRDP
jgi:hypothetical protein